MNRDLISRKAFIDWLDCGHLRNPGEVCFCEADVLHMIQSRPAVDAVEIVRCENCVHQRKRWQSDKRMKEKGFFVYRCELNQDPFVTHVVDGYPGGFCSEGERRADK